jgi:hypothetical protein
VEVQVSIFIHPQAFYVPQTNGGGIRNRLHTGVLILLLALEYNLGKNHI